MCQVNVGQIRPGWTVCRHCKSEVPFDMAGVHLAAFHPEVSKKIDNEQVHKERDARNRQFTW